MSTPEVDRPKCPVCKTGAGKPKDAYVDRGRAQAAMNKLARHVKSTRLNVYPCPAGHGWHVGHRKGTLTADLQRLKRHQAAVRAAAKGSRRRHRR